MVNEKIKRYSFVIIIMTALSVVVQIAANLVSARTINFFGVPLCSAPLGVFFFPFVYIISDVTSDVYGYRASRWIAWITILMQLCLVGLIELIICTTTPNNDFSRTLDTALHTVFDNGFIIIIAGILGAVFGGWVNDIIFQLYRHKEGTDHFLKRKLLSSAGAELVDTIVFITIAFKIGFHTPWFPVYSETGELVTNGVLMMYLVQFVLKYGVEVITSPIAKWCAKKLRNYEGEEVFEDRNKFNIFGFERKYS